MGMFDNRIVKNCCLNQNIAQNGTLDTKTPTFRQLMRKPLNTRYY